MSRKCVLLTTTDCPRCIYFMYKSQYPTNAEPKVGDRLVLEASAFSNQPGNKIANFYQNQATPCLSGEYIVTRVISGNGDILIPELKTHILSNDVEGYGVQVKRHWCVTSKSKPIHVSFVFSGN